MAVKVKVPRLAVRITAKKALIVAGMLCGVAAVLGGLVFTFYWNKYGHIVDERLKQPLFAETAKIYAAPAEIRPGQKLTVDRHRAAAAGSRLLPRWPGRCFAHGHLRGQRATRSPSIQARSRIHSQDGATISFSEHGVDEITGDNGQQLAAYELEPLLVTGLSDENRAKRRLVTYEELPKYLVPAVTSIEDRHFFQHGGVDYVRLIGAGIDDLRRAHYSQGGSTLTMQLARGFFLTPEKHIKRKLIEIIITFQLEHRFTKQQIFQMYANQVPLGQRGSFSIDGFGEAAQAYFGKDVRQLDLPECALLAGIIQSPSRLNPFRHPERALERRNVVLDAMVETGDITKQQAEQAKAAPLQPRSRRVRRRRSALLCRPGSRPAHPAPRRRRLQRAGSAHLHFARPAAAADCAGRRRRRHEACR